MKITIETDSQAEMDQLIKWVTKRGLLDKVEITGRIPESGNIVRGDKSLDPTALFGLWKDNPRTLEEIREASWGGKL